MKKSIFLFFAAILCAIGMNAAAIYNIKSAYVAGTMNDWSSNNANWDLGSGNHCTKTFYVQKSNTNYQFKLVINNKWYTKSGYWYTKDNKGPFTGLTDNGNNMQIETKNITTSTNYVALSFDFWGEYSGDSRLSVTQSAVNALSPTLNAASVALSAGETSVLTASCTGGSGTYGYTYKVTSGGSDVTTTTLSATNGESVTFTAPVAPTEKIYTITITAKDAHPLLDGLPTKTATSTITVAASVEKTHNVTISFKCGETEVKSSELKEIGESTPSSIIAPKVIGYKFVDWTLGDGVQTTDALTSETINITTKSSGSCTLTANYDKLEVVYFVNNSKWSNVNIYGWGGNAPANEGINKWAGVGLTKTSEKIGNYDIYVFDATTDFVKQIIFNNGNGGDDNQTKNYVWADGNYYWHGNANDFAGKTKDEAVKYFTIPFVVGSSEGLFGTTWDITNTANDMQLVDGIYTLVKNNISLPDGTIEYKVVIGHDSWDPSYGKDGNNATLTISKSGKYDVTFTYNPTTHEVNATAELKNEEVVVPTVAMHGTFFGDWNNTENFTIADDKATATLTLLIEKGIYEFGMRIGGSGNWTANGAAFTEADNEKVITGSGDKMSFTANKDGNYTFTWTYETNTLTIAYPAVETIIPRTYTVAGNNRAAFGEEWKPEKTENDMVLQVDGTYKWTKSEIALKKNTEIDFKVVKNHSWDEGSWPSEAWKINTIDKDGYYTITIVFDAITKNITATAEWTGEAPFKDFSNQSATLYFHPSTNWTADHAEFAAYFYNEGFGADAEPKWVNMTDNNTDGVYEVDNSKEHEYVIICRMNPARTETRWNNDDDNKDDAAKAKKPVWNQISTGITIPNTAGDLNTCLAFWTNCQGDVPTSECTWVVPTPLTDANWATIVNTYKDETINLIVERTFVSGQNHTLCLPFNLPTNWLGENSKAYQLSSIVSNSATELELKVTEHTDMLAGQPYIVNATKGNNDYDHLIVSNVTVTNATAGANVVTGGGFKATLQAVTATNGTTDGSTEYYIGATTGNLHKEATNKLGLRALVVLTNTDGTAVQGVRARVAFGENVETGIDNIITTDAPIKVIQNGQLIIIREGVKYNVQGQKL